VAAPRYRVVMASGRISDRRKVDEDFAL